MSTFEYLPLRKKNNSNQEKSIVKKITDTNSFLENTFVELILFRGTAGTAWRNNIMILSTHFTLAATGKMRRKSVEILMILLRGVVVLLLWIANIIQASTDFQLIKGLEVLLFLDCCPMWVLQFTSQRLKGLISHQSLYLFKAVCYLC